MQKIRVLVAASFFVLTSACLWARESKIEVRGAAFAPREKLYRSIYGDLGGSFEIELSQSLANYLDIWGNVSWTPKHGKTVEFDSATKINQVSLSFGIKCMGCIGKGLEGYVGIGPIFTQAMIKDTSYCGQQTKNTEPEVGVVLKTGLYRALGECLFVIIFADYRYQPAELPREVDLGGLRIGIGFGRRF
jgi:hypothetical protein